MSLDTALPTLRQAMRTLGEEFLVPEQVREARRAVMAARSQSVSDAPAIQHLATLWGVSRALVREVVHHYYPAVHEPPPVPTVKLESGAANRGKLAGKGPELVDMMMRGLSLTQVAAQFGVARQGIHRALHVELGRLDRGSKSDRVRALKVRETLERRHQQRKKEAS